MRGYLAATALLIASAIAIPLRATDQERDFSGRWTLDLAASRFEAITQADRSLDVTQDDDAIRCSNGAVQWQYALDGSHARRSIGQEVRDAMVKWEGSALLVNTLVAGAENYAIMDRWQKSRDGDTLTIFRQTVYASRQVAETLVFRREGAQSTEGAGAANPLAGEPKLPALANRPAPGMAPDVTVPMGTRVLLELVGEVSTKYAKEGDRVYLRTAVPVAVDGRVAIPSGSNVQGTITRAKAAGKISGKGELYIRFDNLILPNGVSRDFLARPAGSEGKVEGGGKAADSRTVMSGTGMGAAIGSMARGLPGAALGGGIGALAGVLLSRNQNVVLPAGAHVEMVLDRDLVFRPDELPGNVGPR